MNKNLKEIEKLENERCNTIAKICSSKDISFTEAEELYENNIRTRAIAEMSISMDVDYKQAEKYHDLMCANVKLVLVKETLQTMESGLKKLLKQIC
jgi:hypothetical protein